MYLACFTVNISEINVCGIKTKSNSQSLSVVHYQAVDLGASLMTIDEHHVRPFKKMIYFVNAFLLLIMLCGWSSNCVLFVLEITTVTMMPFPLFSNNVCFPLEFVVFQGCNQSCVRRSSFFLLEQVGFVGGMNG